MPVRSRYLAFVLRGDVVDRGSLAVRHPMAGRPLGGKAYFPVWLPPRQPVNGLGPTDNGAGLARQHLQAWWVDLSRGFHR